MNSIEFEQKESETLESNRITLNVGGSIFYTTRSTLTIQNSFFSGLYASSKADYIFIDRDGTHFRYILNFLRGSTVLPINNEVLQELLIEADFYCLEIMKGNIRTELQKKIQPIPVSIMELVHAIKHN